MFAKAVIIFEFTESEAGRRMLWAKYVAVFLIPSGQILGVCFKFVHDYFLTHFVEVIFHCYPYIRLYAR
jgi:hypothetical protein